MKSSLRITTTCLALLLGTGATLVSTGCAGTSTKESTGEYIDNSAITAKVKSALVSDDVVKAREINVESFRGKVQLSGFVSTEAEKDRAGRVAKGVVGVTEVENNIQVK